MKIQIDVPEKINKKLNVEKAELEMKTKAELVVYILHNYYGTKERKKK